MMQQQEQQQNPHMHGNGHMPLPPGHQQGHRERPPMNFGHPMHNFGPPGKFNIDKFHLVQWYIHNKNLKAVKRR